jgi:glycosyltransferase involved in cell wall biosynthesis
VIATDKIAVTVVIAARNEAANIGQCVSSVAWAREIIVVENDSTDNTVELARSAGAIVMSHPFVTIGGQRNAAIARASSEWILVVDADERATPELGEEIRSVTKRPTASAYRVPRRNFFLGSEINHGGWEHDRPIRLFRSTLRYDSSRVHEHVEIDGAVGELKNALTHEPYASLDSYMEKLDRYSRWWAEDRFERGKRTQPFSALMRARLRFASMYLVKLGFLDGEAGVVLASLAETSVIMKYARLWELQKRNENPK